ncbi:MAG: hypothetical protein QOI92_1548 [Chloroflexota bacterium]|nr:hypothetical protein [Chloroflexota bacterium]
MTGAAERTYLVECYAPGIDAATVELEAARARDAVAKLTEAGGAVQYAGAMFMAGDEVVFHAFRAGGPEIVRRASELASLPFERIVESVAVGGDGVLPST